MNKKHKKKYLRNPHISTLDNDFVCCDRSVLFTSKEGHGDTLESEGIAAKLALSVVPSPHGRKRAAFSYCHLSYIHNLHNILSFKHTVLSTLVCVCV